MDDPAVLHIPLDREDAEDADEMLEQTFYTLRTLVSRAREQYQSETWISEPLMAMCTSITSMRDHPAELVDYEAFPLRQKTRFPDAPSADASSPSSRDRRDWAPSQQARRLRHPKRHLRHRPEGDGAGLRALQAGVRHHRHGHRVRPVGGRDLLQHGHSVHRGTSLPRTGGEVA